MNNGLVRDMEWEDLDAISQIERLTFTMPWSMDSFKTELKENEYARYFCLESEGRVIGYMGLWLIFDEGHITNIAVLPDFQGLGWGGFLLRSVMAEMRMQGMARMTLEVRASNSPALALYRRYGFTVAGVRKKYYADNGEDALIMWAELSEEREVRQVDAEV